MACLAPITKTVIDRGLRISHSLGMLTADDILAELFRQIEANEIAQVKVARHLGIAPARVTEMKKGTRQLKASEMQPLAELLGMVEPDPFAVVAIDAPYLIPNLGKVAQGVWLEQTTDDDSLAPVPYDRFRGDPLPTDLFAVTPVGTSMNLRFPEGTRLICQRVPFGICGFKPGQYAIVSRSAHDLRELTCKRVEVDNDGNYWLYSESSDPRFAEPWLVGKPSSDHHDDVEIAVEGLVIRAVQNLNDV